MHNFPNIGFRDNKKLKQGHFEMGIHYVNFMPISNRCTRKRATLCPLAKCYTHQRKWLMKLCRIELAWQGVKNPSGIAIGELNGNELRIESVYPCCRDVKAVIDYEPDIVGYAIDDPLIINDILGLRWGGK